MIVGLGTDIIQVKRMAGAIERHGQRILDRLFTAEEQAYCSGRAEPELHYAARFAAKEATMKALGTGWRRGVRWRDIEVGRAPSGRPTLKLEGAAAEHARELGADRLLVTLTHDQLYGSAVVILESTSAGERR